MIFHKFKYNIDFKIKNNCVVLTSTGRKKIYRPKKITGSRLANVIGCGEFSSPFQTWCDIFGFYKPEIDPFFLEAGIEIEPKLRKYVEDKIGCKFKSYNGPDVGFDVFKENEIFGGLPDGEPFDFENNKFTYDNNFPMLEIKTTSMDEFYWTKKDNEMFLVRDENNIPQLKNCDTKFAKWIDQKQIKIPDSYMYQLGLYLYLRNLSTGIFCIGFLKFEDYLNPKNFDLNKRIILLEKFSINLQEFQTVINYATNWYQDYVEKFISPPMTPSDLEWFSYGYPELKK